MSDYDDIGIDYTDQGDFIESLYEEMVDAAYDDLIARAWAEAEEMQRAEDERFGIG